MSQTRSRSHHELAQRLDLARRERGLSSKDLSDALSCDPRTVRRYLSGERQPNRQVVELWERACDLEPGALTPFHERATGVQESREAEPPPPVSPRRKARLAYLAVPVAVLLAAAGVFFLSSDSPEITREPPSRSDIPHHFTPEYTGQVSFRVIPASGRGGDEHRVRLRWGDKQDEFAVRRLGSGGQTFRLRKTGTDDTTFLVKVDPPASVEFAEGDQPDDDARDVPSNWTDRPDG